MPPIRHITKNLDGDGRWVFVPNPKIDTAGNPIKTKLNTIRMFVSMLKEKGVTFHSRNQSTVWCLQEWCELNNQKYEIGEGFFRLIE